MQSSNILVVGGSHGIGFGIVQRCVSAGASVTVLSRTPGDLAGVPEVNYIPGDVAEPEALADQLPDSLDGFVYCPGTINLGPLRSVTPEVMRSDFELNVVGGLRCFQTVLPAMKRANHSSAVFFSTVAVATGLPMHTSVAASKGAIEALTRSWAAELSPSVRVNAIAPALTDTPLAAKFLGSDEKRKAMADRYPLKRIGNVDDIASAAVFLLSPENSWITGQVIRCDGGMSTITK